MPMQWSAFVTAVLEHLSVDATRRGIENLRSRAIVNAVIDLQRYIVSFRAAHTTVYSETDLIPQGCAHLGLLPSGAHASRFYIFTPGPGIVTPGSDFGTDFNSDDFASGAASGGSSSGPDFGTDYNPADFKNTGTSSGAGAGPDFNPADFGATDFKTTGTTSGGTPADFAGSDFSGTDFKTVGTTATPSTAPASFLQGATSLQNRNHLDFQSWNRRQAMIDGVLGCRAYRYAISPTATRFLIFPQISNASNTKLLLVWDGIKQSFSDNDIVPFTDAAAEAVGYYVKSKIQREVDKNIALSRENERDYVAKRLALYRDAQDALIADREDEENAPNDVAPTKLQ